LQIAEEIFSGSYGCIWLNKIVLPNVPTPQNKGADKE
jgi:hypothetical protein